MNNNESSPDMHVPGSNELTPIVDGQNLTSVSHPERHVWNGASGETAPFAVEAEDADDDDEDADDDDEDADDDEEDDEFDEDDEGASDEDDSDEDDEEDEESE
jgi:hypothetical protein